jgi:hypothetical protein
MSWQFWPLCPRGRVAKDSLWIDARWMEKNVRTAPDLYFLLG